MRRPSARTRIRVCVVAAHSLAGQYLLLLLKKDPRIIATLLRDPANLRTEPRVGVFLVDCAGLPLPLHECLSRLQLCEASARFVVVGDESMGVDRMLQLGIHGFLRYGDVVDDLSPAIRAVHQAEIWVQPGAVQEHMRRTLSSDKNRLTRRETEIMELLKKRMSNNEIAGVLGIRDSTVKFHVSNLLSKLQVTNRRDLRNREESFLLWNKLLLYSSLRRL